jgi:sulfatase maturation enzyme AslB (radical SAM superfamily)
MRIVEIEATNQCNTRCRHCPREAIVRSRGRMSWETFCQVADQILGQPGIEAVDFSGMGEPLLSPLLERFVARLSPHLDTLLTTNAALLTRERASALIEAGLGTAIISYNGHTPELYAEMMGGLSIERADANIRQLVRAAEGRVRVVANVSVTPQTRGALPQIRARLRDLGVDEASFSLCHNRGGHLDDPTACDAGPLPVGRERCDIFADTLFVAWNGDVLSCCHDLAGEGRMGSLCTAPLQAIVEERQRLLAQGLPFPMCEKCNDTYRMARDPTPDRQPLSEWIYALYRERDANEPGLMEVVRRQEARIDELEALIERIQQGKFMRLMGWVHRTRQRVLGALGVPGARP